MVAYTPMHVCHVNRVSTKTRSDRLPARLVPLVWSQTRYVYRGPPPALFAHQACFRRTRRCPAQNAHQAVCSMQAVRKNASTAARARVLCCRTERISTFVKSVPRASSKGYPAACRATCAPGASTSRQQGEARASRVQRGGSCAVRPGPSPICQSTISTSPSAVSASQACTASTTEPCVRCAKAASTSI